MHPTHPPFPRKTNALKVGWGVAFQEGRGSGESCWRHTPCIPELGVRADSVPVSHLPATSPLGFTSQIVGWNGRGCLPCRVSTPFPGKSSLALPPLDTLTRPSEKWFCSGFRVDEVLRAAGLSAFTQPSRPSPTRNYLLAFSGFRWLGRLPGALGSRRQPCRRPAEPPAFILRAVGSPRADLGAQSHHRAGLGGPWSSGRVQPALAAQPGAARAASWGCSQADPRSGELTRPKVRSPGSDLDLQVSFVPPKQPLLAGAVPSAPHRSPSTTAATAQSWGNGRSVGGWVWGSYVVPTRFIYFPFVKLYSHPLWSVCLIYTPLSISFLFPLPHPSQQVREKNLRPIASFS